MRTIKSSDRKVRTLRKTERQLHLQYRFFLQAIIYARDLLMKNCPPEELMVKFSSALAQQQPLTKKQQADLRRYLKLHNIEDWTKHESSKHR